MLILLGYAPLLVPVYDSLRSSLILTRTVIIVLVLRIGDWSDGLRIERVSRALHVTKRSRRNGHRSRRIKRS